MSLRKAIQGNRLFPGKKTLYKTPKFHEYFSVSVILKGKIRLFPVRLSPGMPRIHKRQCLVRRNFPELPEKTSAHIMDGGFLMRMHRRIRTRC